MAIRIGIAGITGRMGQLLAEEVQAADAELTGGIGRPGSVKSAPADATLLADIGALAAGSDVVVDFTNAATARAYAAAMAESGKAWVLGSSGLSDEDEAAVADASRRIPVVYASNFSAGVNLVLALAERMGAALPADAYDAEIVEMHHRQKVDAPSGTAIGMGRAVAKGRGVALGDVMESGRHGHTGARKTGAIGFAALRGGQVVGEHTLIFAAGTEHIALTHRAFDRRAFATGAVRAALWVAGRKPGLYSMMDVLGDGLSEGAARFVARYPRVWHVIEADGAGAWLTQTGLLPAEEICRIAGLPSVGTNRDRFQSVALGGGRVAVLRPQLMADHRLLTTLSGALAGRPDLWRQHVNRHVFFWTELRRRDAFMRACTRLRIPPFAPPVALAMDTSALLARHGAIACFATINIGSTMRGGARVRRDETTLRPLSEYRSGAVAELAIRGCVDIAGITLCDT